MNGVEPMNTRTILLSLALMLTAFPLASAASPGTFEGSGDTMSALQRGTYMSFVGIGLAFVATAFFLFMERNDVHRDLRPALGVGVMIVGIAGFQYNLMAESYLFDGSIPTDFRYADWFSTVPLMALCFPLVAGRKAYTNKRLFDLPGLSVPGLIMIGAFFMIASGYLGQVELDAALKAGTDPASIHWYWFAQGMLGYLGVIVIAGTPFTGAYGLDDTKVTDTSLRTALSRMRKLILVGWLIYPVGYVLGAMGSGVEEMVLAYNVADLVNKVGFVIIVWHGVRNAESSRALAHDMEAGFHTLAHAEDKQDNAPSDDLLAIAAMSRGETVEEPEDDL